VCEILGDGNMPVMSVEQKGLRGGKIGGKPHAVRPGKCAPPHSPDPATYVGTKLWPFKVDFLVVTAVFFSPFLFVVVDL